MRRHEGETRDPRPDGRMGSRAGAIAVILCLLGIAGEAAGQADGLTLAEDGTSKHVIFRAETAPTSVKQAAEELQTYVEKVTGAKLPITGTFREEDIISLGVHDGLKRFDLTTDGIKTEGYRIVTRSGNLFIFGDDTPDGEQTPQGGVSRGTLYGTCTFIEDQLGVRWLMPMDYGDYVPKNPTLRVPALSITDAPDFQNRYVPYLQDRVPQAKRWADRQKVGRSLFLSHGHSWQRVFKPELFEDHPEYFAEIGGVRQKPVGHFMKICTSSKGAIQYFADAIIRYFDDDPKRTVHSLSPTDARGWCECAKCTALDETDALGKRSVTGRILPFYNAVAEIVAKKHPDKLLCGYVYQDYVFPPKDRSITLHRNVFLVWAPLFDYGFTHFRPDIRELWHKTCGEWAAFTDKLAYYDLCNKAIQDYGAPNPPCPEILKSIYPALKKHGFKGTYMYGVEPWGYGAPLNYLLVKLNWDADADVDALLDEFYQKCYGPAAADMKALNTFLEEELAKHYRADHKAGWKMTHSVLQEVYGKNFAQIESMYLAALAKVGDGPEKQRLEAFGDNLYVLCQTLRHAGMLPNAETSKFCLSDEAYHKFLKKNAKSLAIHTGKTNWSYVKKRRDALKSLTMTPAEGAAPAGEAPKPLRLRANQHIVLVPANDGEVEIGVTVSGTFPGITKYAVYGSNGKIVKDGIVGGKSAIRFTASAGAGYQLFVDGPAYYTFRMPKDVAWAVSSTYSREHALALSRPQSPLLFHVPEGVKDFRLTLSCPSWAAATAKLYNPAGKEVAAFRTVESPVDSKRVACGEGEAGFWKLVIGKAEKGSFSWLAVQIDEKLPGFVCPEPDKRLIVKKR